MPQLLFDGTAGDLQLATVHEQEDVKHDVRQLTLATAAATAGLGNNYLKSSQDPRFQAYEYTAEK